MLKLQFSGYYRSLSKGTKYEGNKEKWRRSPPTIRPLFGQARREEEFQLRFNPLLMAMKENDGGMSGFAGKSWEPDIEIEVPFEQRPVNEYSSLKNSFLYSWGELDPGSFFLRLGVLCAINFGLIGAPISAASFDPSKDSLRFILAAGTGTLLLVSLVVLRIYLGNSLTLQCS